MPGKRFVLITLLAIVSVGIAYPLWPRGSAAVGKRVIVIGMDGMDPRLCTQLMDEGAMPNLASLRRNGGFSELGTTTPPQSPVAWASFITGANPGVHGIFDFIHRDPAKQCAPYYSAAQTISSKEGWEVGDHRIPLTFWPFQHAPNHTLLRRHGTPFWDYLDAAGIQTWLYDIPANYPPSPSQHGHMCCLSGMGVPDLLGTYGTYQYFSEDTYSFKNDGGGYRRPLMFDDHHATAILTGPHNTNLTKPAETHVVFEVYRHPTEPTARIEIQGQTIVLREGEWSDWRRVTFDVTMPPFLPDAEVSGICRFYVQQVHDVFRLYVSPLNIDPSSPGDQRITEPEDFARDLSESLGLFATIGFQEDHKALSNGVFNDADYATQAEHVLAERLALLDHALAEYRDGLLFFYFSSTDLQSHMFWWDDDVPHPARSPAQAKYYNDSIAALYSRMDGVVGEVIERYGDSATIVVMSDHGFCSFRRQFNLNTWLRDEGYVQPRACRSILLDPDHPVDWKLTQAYGLGLNALYINLAGRERDGVVSPTEYEALLDELTLKLLAVRDPLNGQAVIARVDRGRSVYKGDQVEHAPDLVIGYHRGYRASWATTLGHIGDGIVSENDSAWSADHCIAPELVPGVLFSNRPLRRLAPTLIDLAPTILSEFGIAAPATMTGGSVFEESTPPQVTRKAVSG
jgi:predicted AlkP superfamily phosphohydrolase/phosphomutase